MRYGSLFEAPLLDCAGHMTISGPSPVLLPASVEQWVVDRIKSSNVAHFALVPSHPFGWTAGKWREWYPDVVAPEGFTGLVTNELLSATQGVLTSAAEKYLWQRGWWVQHQRLLSALASRMTTLISPFAIPLQIVSFFFFVIPECQTAGVKPKNSINFFSN